MTVNIIFPVLNERLRLEKGIRKAVEYLEGVGFRKYRITIVDNGSTDETPEIGKRLCEEFPKVRYIQLRERGVGVAFRKGVEENTCDIVGYMDIDLSTDIRYLGKAIKLFRTDEKLQYINATRFSRQSHTTGRKWYRQISSRGLLVLLKVFLQMKATDAICGFTFLRKEAAEELIRECGDENGWFYMIEFLLRAERKNMKILDYPVKWEEDYNTTVRFFSVTADYLKNICRLFIEFHIKEKGVHGYDKKN